MKNKETLEEVADRFQENFKTTSEKPYGLVFKLGAKWQQEQNKKMYSKEAVDNLLYTLIENNMCSVKGDELIEEFKKKL